MCQVCHHEPLDKSLCTPHKNLRMTVKAVLKKKLVERANKRKQEEAAIAAAAKAENTPAEEPTPAVTEDSGADPAALVDASKASDAPINNVSDHTVSEVPTADTPREQDTPNIAQPDNVLPSVEVGSDHKLLLHMTKDGTGNKSCETRSLSRSTGTSSGDWHRAE